MITSPEIHERLDRLERSNRRLKTAFLVCLGCALAVMVMGAASPAPKLIEAQKIILRDSAGNERGELFASDTSWGLVLFNRNNTRAASLVVGSKLNALLLNDQNGNIRQAFSADMNESAWNLFRPGSDSAQFLLTDNPQGTVFTVRDRANNDRVTLGVSPQGAGITMADANGATRTIMADSGMFLAFSRDGVYEWSSGLDMLSPDGHKRVKELLQLFPRLP